jgi:hypothetical protein
VITPSFLLIHSLSLTHTFLPQFLFWFLSFFFFFKIQIFFFFLLSFS